MIYAVTEFPSTFRSEGLYMNNAMERKQEPVFQIGLALAGAISAGAYTAGVLDFLFQALGEWEKMRAQQGVLTHRVVIKVIAGASAGAITGGVGAVALARGLMPYPFDQNYYKTKCYPDRYEENSQQSEYVLPSLYHTWVKLPAMTTNDGKGGLLATDDLKNDFSFGVPILRSLLNAEVLDEIKRKAITPFDAAPNAIVAWPFIAQQLHMYFTISNMRGIPFKVEFGRSSYGMQTIADRIHYVISDLGTCDLELFAEVGDGMKG
jgi:hypothetical protein